MKIIDQILGAATKISALLCLVLVLLTTEQVLARYFFNAASIGVQEMEWHLFGMIFLLAAAPALVKGEHVRVDIVYGRMSQRWRRRIDIGGHLFLLMPTACVLVWYGFQSVLQARAYGAIGAENADFIGFLFGGERSPDPGGLPARWIIKSFVPLCGILLILAAVREVFALSKQDPNGV